jgi:hypothetical protein
MRANQKPTVRIEDDKAGGRCHVVIDPNKYAPRVQVNFESHGEARQWLNAEFPRWYTRYERSQTSR